MEIKEIENELLELGRLRVNSEQEVKDEKCHIFYFVAYKDNLVRSSYIELDSKIFKKSEKKHSLREFLLEQDTVIKKYKDVDAKELQFSIYKVNKTLDNRTYNKLFTLVDKVNPSKLSIKAFYKHFNDYSKLYSGIFGVYLLVYTMIIHIILLRTGHSIDVIQGIEVILGMFGLFLFTILSIYTGIFLVSFILAILNGNISLEWNLITWMTLIFLVFCIVGSFIKQKTNLHYKIYSYKHILKTGIKEGILGFNIGVLAIVAISTMVLPWFFIFESLKMEGISKDGFSFDVFYKLYYGFSSYQRIALNNNKTYIVSGTDKINYFVHDINKTTNYIYSNEEKDKKYLKQLCLNIQDELTKKQNQDEVSIIYQILAQSNYNYVKNYEFINVKNENLTFLPLTLYNMGFDEKQLQYINDKCNSIKKK